MNGVVRSGDGDTGIFTVIPEIQAVHYQRRNSAFALHDPSVFNWHSVERDGCYLIQQILSNAAHAKKWLHITGITPMISAPVRTLHL
jgi:hypothetical protein